MAHSVTHVLVPIILLELFRDYIIKDKKKFPLHYVLIGGIAGLLPDLDFIVFWMLYSKGFALEAVHRTFSHTLFVPLLFLLLGFLTIRVKSKRIGKHHMKLSTIFFVVAFSSFIHLVLDVLIIGYIMPFYPFSHFSMGWNIIYLLPFSQQIVDITIPPAIDAMLLVLWLIHEEWKHKISDFI
jgi:membrane-bound metal-dependent hydrolase YbcI (DUF457 family)